MTVRSLGSSAPRIAATAWISEAAYVVGDVEIGEHASVWPHAVVRGDYAPIRIGARTHLEDGVIVHSGVELTVGDGVLVGHGALVHCRSVGRGCLIGSRSILLDHVEVPDWCMVAAGSLVLTGTEIPPGSFVVGAPATVRPATVQQLDLLRRIEASSGGYDELSRRYRDAGL